MNIKDLQFACTLVDHTFHHDPLHADWCKLKRGLKIIAEGHITDPDFVFFSSAYIAEVLLTEVRARGLLREYWECLVSEAVDCEEEEWVVVGRECEGRIIFAAAVLRNNNMPEMKSDFPERVRLRNTKLHDDLGGGGQLILTTAGHSYDKMEYVRSDLVDVVSSEREQFRKRMERLADAIFKLHQAALPDPYDQRDVDGKWLADQIHEAYKKVME